MEAQIFRKGGPFLLVFADCHLPFAEQFRGAAKSGQEGQNLCVSLQGDCRRGANA